MKRFLNNLKKPKVDLSSFKKNNLKQICHLKQSPEIEDIVDSKINYFRVFPRDDYMDCRLDIFDKVHTFIKIETVDVNWHWNSIIMVIT